MQYKKGSKIFAIENSVWGKFPLTVEEDTGTLVLTKKDNRFPAGAFGKSEVEPYSEARAKKLEKLAKLKQKLDLETEKLFGK